jgi:hypothetical protein
MTNLVLFELLHWAVIAMLVEVILEVVLGLVLQ